MRSSAEVAEYTGLEREKNKDEKKEEITQFVLLVKIGVIGHCNLLTGTCGFSRGIFFS